MLTGILVFLFLGNFAIDLGPLLTGATVAEQDLKYSESEKKALGEFKSKVLPQLKLDFMKSDFYLIRWLRAQNLSIPDAESMLHRHLKWREDNGIDKMPRENFADIEVDYPYQTNTRDLEGKSVHTADMQEWDIRKAVVEGKIQRLYRYIFNIVENVTRQIMDDQAKGGKVTRFVVLGNAGGFNEAQHSCKQCLPAIVQFVNSFEGQYPGFVDEIILIDAPNSIHDVIDLVKPLMLPETVRSLKVFGQNREQWMKYLDAKIARDQRTAKFGGTKKEKDA